jgi:hypothetical protein
MKPFAICLGDVQDAVIRTILGNRVMSNPGIAIGTTKSKAKTANTTEYCIDGVIYSKAATDDLFVHTDVSVQAVGTTRYYALCLDAAGAATVIAGATTANVAGSTYPIAAKMPPIPSTVCLVGAIKIVTDATHTYTPATTLNDAAGITATYYNLAGVVPAAGIPG